MRPRPLVNARSQGKHILQQQTRAPEATIHCNCQRHSRCALPRPRPIEHTTAHPKAIAKARVGPARMGRAIWDAQRHTSTMCYPWRRAPDPNI
eukprot:2851359-Pyramimonas_sp.AAC.1